MKHTQEPLSLQSHHIVDLYCWIADQLPAVPRRTVRPSLLTEAEVITILVWNTLVLRQKTLKDIHRTIQLYHGNDFQLPKYSAFVTHCHRATPHILMFLQLLLADRETVRIMDATMLPVCKIHRADRHKVAKDIADFGKNHQGWHYGFKLHASTALDGRFCGIALTGANVYDAQMMHRLLNKYCEVAVGDTLYGASVMRNRMYRRYGTIIIAPPHPKQKRKIATDWQIDLLNIRSKIESVFGVLKEHLHLVSSFPRSATGYVVHYVRVLLSYQIMALSKGV